MTAARSDRSKLESDSSSETDLKLRQALKLLSAGEPVAIPTETVYGLAADAAQETAVRQLYAIKARPAQHPLIVHLAGIEALSHWAREIPESAFDLAEKFWPGPLTLILKKTNRAAPSVSAGLDTIGIRVPNHPLTHKLLLSFQNGQGGLAAPSANRYGKVSPTTAQHVRDDLGSMVPLILDGGPCAVGLESTVLDLSREKPVLLRHGGIPREALQETLHCTLALEMQGPIRSPGQSASHYAPAAEVLTLTTEALPEKARELIAQGFRVGVLAAQSFDDLPSTVVKLALSNDSSAAARALYAALREADRLGCQFVLTVLPPEAGLGSAIADRLRRAASPRHI